MGFTNQMFLTIMQNQARLQQEASLYSLEALERTEPLNVFYSTPTQEQFMATNAALHQHVYELDTRTRHLQQVLYLAQEPIHLVVESIDLDALWQDVSQTFYQDNKSAKFLIQHNTKTKFLRGDGGKIRKLLLAAMSYAAVYPNTQRPILLHIEDTHLAYPLMSIPGYVKRVQSLCIAVTTERILLQLKTWYVGSVDNLLLQWPQDIGELPLAYN
jgi:hypothetical protein